MLPVLVVFCSWLAFLCSFVDRLSWPPIIPLALGELSLTRAEAGGFMSAFFLGYLLTQLPGGMLADRFGIRRVLSASLLLTGSFTLLFAWVNGYWSGLALRFMAGLGSGAILAASVKGVYDHFPAHRRATAMGFFMTSLPAGLMLANLMSPAIAASYGWRISFVVAGVLTLVVFFVALGLLPSSGLKPSDNLQTNRTSFALLLRNRSLLVTAAAGFFAMWGTWGVLTWNNAFMHQGLGLSLEQSGRMMALFAVGALVGQPLAGKIADCYPANRRHVGMAILLGFSVLLLVFGQLRTPSFAPLLSPLLGAASFIFGPVLNTLISELVAPDQVGTAIGFCNAFWQIGSLISPFLAGLLLDLTGDYGLMFFLLSAGPLLSVLLLGRVREGRS